MAGNRRIVLARRPAGPVSPDHFRLETAPAPEPGEGQVLTRTLWLSLDPYVRSRIQAGPSYAAGTEPGEVLPGATVGEIVESRHPDWPVGTVVLGAAGWQDYAIAAPTALRRLDAAAAPPSTALGVLGMPGLTAYVGLLDLGRPRTEETVVVSAASGAVGSVAGQIARIRGCRVVGIAGSPAKCDWVTGELGFDACIDRRAATDLAGALQAACPDGIGVYFDNVGGAVLDAALDNLAVHARVVVCGMISVLNRAGTTQNLQDLRKLFVRRASLHCFVVSDHVSRQEAFLAEAGGWLREGRLRYREDVVEGLENVPAAFPRLFSGDNFGKLVVRVAEPA